MNHTDYPQPGDRTTQHQVGAPTDDLLDRTLASEPQLLRHCDVGDVVTTPAGRVVVVLDPAPAPDDTGDALATAVEVYGENGLTSLPADELVLPVRDADRQVAPLKDAVAALEHRHRADRDTIAALRAGHGEELAEIRRYAIQRFLDRDICRDGLDRFLAHFALGEYRPRLRVTFTLTGSYDVDDEDGDTDAAVDEARTYLRADLHDVDAVIAGSVQVALHIDDVTTVDC